MHGWNDLFSQISVTYFNHPKAVEEKVLESIVQSLSREEGFLSFVDNWQKHLFTKIDNNFM